MKMFLKNGENFEISWSDEQAISNLRTKPLKVREEARLDIGGRQISLRDIKLVGDWCHNQYCSRLERIGLKAHPKDEVCDYDLTGSCEACGKQMWKRDCDYAEYKFGRIVCAKHCGVDIFMNKPEPMAVMEQQEHFLQTNELADIPF